MICNFDTQEKAISKVISEDIEERLHSNAIRVTARRVLLTNNHFVNIEKNFTIICKTFNK